MYWYKLPRSPNKRILWDRAHISDSSPVKNWLGPIFYWYKCPLCRQTFGEFMSYHQYVYNLDTENTWDEFKRVEAEQCIKEKRNPNRSILTGHPMPCDSWEHYPYHCNKISAKGNFRGGDGGCNYYGRTTFKCGIPMYNLLQETSFLDVSEEIS